MQRVRLVLRDDADAADAGVEAVGQREVDDAELAAEVDGRLRALVGERSEAGAAPAGENDCEGRLLQIGAILRQRLHASLLI